MERRITQPREQSNLQASTNMALSLAKRDARRINRLAKRKPKRRNNRPRRKGNSRRPAMIFPPMKHIQECSLHYASALMDPEFTPSGACVPYGFPTPSQRIKTFARGTFQCGTTGQGFVLASPALANDAPVVTTTGTTSVGTNATVLSSFTNLTNVTMPKLPYTTAQLTAAAPGVSGRLVALGLKCRYAGTEAGRNGGVTSLEEPQHKNIALLTGSTVLTYPQGYKERPKPDGSWHSVMWSGPVNADETKFSNLATYSTAGCLVLYVEGVASDNYEWEIYGHYEFAGSLPPEQVTGHSAPEEYGKLITTTKEATNAQPLSINNGKSTFTKFLENAGSTIKDIAMTMGPEILNSIISPKLIPYNMMKSVMPGLFQPGRPQLLYPGNFGSSPKLLGYK